MDMYWIYYRVYAAVRSDIDRNSTAYKLFEFLTTAEGQNIVNESGYVPLDKASSVRSIYGANDITLSTIYTDLQGISHKTRQKGIMIKTDVYRDGKKHSTKILAE